MPWIEAQLHVERGSGTGDVIAAYRDVLAGAVRPDTVRVLTW